MELYIRFFTALWNKYPYHIIGAIGFIDLILLYVVLKKLFPSQKKSNESVQLLQKIPELKIPETPKNNQAPAPIEALPKAAIANFQKNLQKNIESNAPIQPAEVKPIETFDEAELKNVQSVKRSIRLSAIRNSVIKDKAKLFELKRLLDDKDDALAVYALRAILKADSSIVSTEMLKQIIERANNKKVLMISNLKRIAQGGNTQVFSDLLNNETPEWIYIASLKILFKVRAQELAPLLVDALQQESVSVKLCAQDIMNKIEQLADAEKIPA